MSPASGAVGLGVAKEFGLDLGQNTPRSSLTQKFVMIVLKKASLHSRHGHLLSFLIPLTIVWHAMNHGAEKVGVKANSGLCTQMLEDSQLMPEPGEFRCLSTAMVSHQTVLDVFCWGLAILLYWELCMIYLKATLRRRKRYNMANSRECPSIKYFKILVFINGTYLGLKAAKSVCAASVNKIQISYNGNEIKF